MEFNLKKILIILGIIILLALVIFGCTKIPKDSSTKDEERAEAEIIALEEGKQLDSNFNIVGNAIQTYEKNLKYLGCSDSDGSKNYDVYGEVTLKYSNRNKQTTQIFKDRCHKNNQLLEYYCKNNRLALAVYKCPNGCENGACKNKLNKFVLIITNDYLVDEFKEEFSRYSKDLKKEFNYDVQVIGIENSNLNWNTIDAEIHNRLNKDLIGVLLVGDIPSVLVNGDKISDNFYYAKDYSSCVYDKETNSYILDINEDCYFSSSIFPREKPFWIARITPDWDYEDKYLSAMANCYDGTSINISSNLCKTRIEFTETGNQVCAERCSQENPDKCGLMNVYTHDFCDISNGKISSSEIKKIKDYFLRNHLYRTSKLKNNEKILFYITDSMNQYDPGTYLAELNFYSNSFNETDLYFSDGSAEDNGNNFLQQLEEKYGFVMVNAHGMPSYHEHNIYANRIPNINSTFMLLKSCSVGKYTEKNSIAPTYLMKGALLVDSSSVPLWANSKLPIDVNYLLKNGLTYNDATFFLPEYYSHIIFGDPTLRLTYSPIKICDSKLKVLENYKEINLNKGEIQTTIKIKNIGTSDLFLRPYITYSASSPKIARIVTSFAARDPLKPGQELSVPFFIEMNFSGSGEQVSHVRFVTNDCSKPISEEVTIRVIN